MNKIDSIKIDKFWGDKDVIIQFKEDVNFLIGVNGSGKTTIINLIAATLNADFPTLDRFDFKKITISLLSPKKEKLKSNLAYIEVEKTNKKHSPYQNIQFKIKNFNDSQSKSFDLDELEEDNLIHQPREWFLRRRMLLGETIEKDINTALKSLVNVSWLSIHRTTHPLRRREEKNWESTVDLKIEELQIDLVKYFSLLNRRYSIETENFQKYIFESLIEISHDESFRFEKNINAEKEKESLRQIFQHFKLNEKAFSTKLDKYFNTYDKSLDKVDKNEGLSFSDLSILIGTRRINTVVQKWNEVISKQKKINKSRETFLSVINNLLQRKELQINERNELIVKTQSGKLFPLTNLSSGEKQLLIILGQSLLQEENVHIYIADEPELSLHVEWQEKLVSSLKNINPSSQIIFATHSPDIVGSYTNSVINIEDTIK